MKKNITYREACWYANNYLPYWKYLYDKQNSKYIYSEMNSSEVTKFYV